MHSDHVHVYVGGKEVGILRQLKGSYTLETLPEGHQRICVKVVMTQVVHNFGAVAVAGGAAFALWAKIACAVGGLAIALRLQSRAARWNEARRKLAWRTLGAGGHCAGRRGVPALVLLESKHARPTRLAFNARSF